MRKVCICLFLALTLFAMAFIYMESAMDSAASSTQSENFSNGVANIIRPENPETDRTPEGKPTEERQTFLDKIETIVRNMAHVAEFAMLGCFAYSFALALGCDKTKKRTFLALPATLAFCVLYALSDEWHQTKTPGRAFEYKDIGLDSTGAFIGILFSLLIFCFYTFLKHKKEKNSLV